MIFYFTSSRPREREKGWSGTLAALYNPAMQGIDDLFSRPKPLIAVVHLLPLPGSPHATSSLKTVLDRALSDARLLADNGVDGLLVENYGDAPFHPEAVDPCTVAAMAVIASAVRQQHPKLPLGINVLRNDASAALAIATAVEGRFIRVNVHTGTMLTDQGVLQGRAHQTLRQRAALGQDIRILADVAVKHATLPAPAPLANLAADTYRRGLADALIVTGPATASAANPSDLEAVRTAVPEAALLTGSGVTPENLATILPLCDGVIVGSSLKRNGIALNEVEAERVRKLVGCRDAWKEG
ncbi:MAG: BtpA/SgcQ family protein [Acidobacteriota bacterium]